MEYDPYGNYVCYIYGKDQEKAAKINKKLLQQKYIVYLNYVSSTEGFTSAWNKIGLNSRNQETTVDIVIINLHGNYTDVEYVDFSKLKRKKIDTLLLLTCYSGCFSNQYSNAAYKFFKNHDIKQIVCCDGKHRRKISLFNTRVIHRVVDYETHTGTSVIKSRGFLVYRKESGKYPRIYSIGNEFSSVKKLLSKVGKW